VSTVWVTGAAGFIGSHVVSYLESSKGRHVGGVLAASDTLDSVGSWVSGKIDHGKLSRLAEMSGSPETIYHLAGGSSVSASLADPALDFQRTVVSTASLLEWMRRHAPEARLVFVSSAAVYGAGHAGQISKEAPTRPFSPYGFHKQAAELLCRSSARSFGTRVAIARLFSVYGTGLRKQLLWDLCCKLTRDGRARLAGTGSELRDWAHIADVVRLLEYAAERASNEAPIFNGGTGEAVSVRQIAELVAASLGLPASVLEFSGEVRAGDPFSLVAVPEPGTAWRTKLPEGIADYVEWFRNEGAEPG
jgi:UDP-glucose 4-epimerase